MKHKLAAFLIPVLLLTGLLPGTPLGAAPTTAPPTAPAAQAVLAPGTDAMRPTAGVAFKPQHFDEALAASADGLWFEVHAENYMVPGGPRLAMLSALREARPLSLHGVGLSLGSSERPDAEHLRALKQLVDRFDPWLVSEHLAWSRVGSRCLPDLLPVPRTYEALLCAARTSPVQSCRAPTSMPPISPKPTSEAPTSRTPT